MHEHELVALVAAQIYGPSLQPGANPVKIEKAVELALCLVDEANRQSQPEAIPMPGQPPKKGGRR